MRAFYYLFTFFNDLLSIHIHIGGRAYWAGRAAARPLFAPNGQTMMFALPRFALLKFKKTSYILLPFVQC